MKTKRNFSIRDGKYGSALKIRLIPRSSRNEVVAILEDGTIKIRITAPPVDGQANLALIQFLAKILDTAPSQIELISGQSSRDKLVMVIGIDPTQAQEKILSNK